MSADNAQAPRKSATKTRGKPFAPGNSGKPKGARHKTTRAVEELMEGDAEAITKKAIELAKAGDTVALRLCMERIAPAPKDRTISFALPKIETIDDASRAQIAILEGVANGDVSPSEAVALSSLLDGWRRAVETGELAERIKNLEATHGA